MTGRKFIACLVAIFFMSYNLIVFQYSIGQVPQAAIVYPPSIKAPPFIIARATGPSWTQVNFEVTANSSTSDNIPVYCSPASGSAFPMGKTIVLCAARETLTGLASYAVFNVTVKDTSPPKFKVPHDILKEADNIQGTRITYIANASDTIDGNTIPTCDPPSGSTFPLGTNYVTCTATDKSGNLAESSFSVIIKTPKGKISNTEPGISEIFKNMTNQQQSSELTVSENITNVPQPTAAIQNGSRPPPSDILNNEILNMFKILIEDLK